MSDQDRIRQREHWQAIAEQLGLAREPEPPSPPFSPAAAEASPETSSEESSAEVKRGQDRMAQVHDYLKSGPGRRSRDTRPAEERASASVSAKPPTAQEVVEDVATPEKFESEERSSPAKRGRGRRPAPAARVSEDRPSGTSSAEAITQEMTPREPTTERHPRRGRGRGRRKKAQDPEPAAVAQEQVAPGDQDEGDDEDFGNASAWSVPSWTELIASLYRPER